MSNIPLHIDGPLHPVDRVYLRPAVALLLLLLAGCTASRPATMDTIEVAGMVTVRGNEPFTELVLQTSERNHYVLKFESPEERTRMQNLAPATFTVAGEVYRDVWGSQAFAHLRVRRWQSATGR